MIDYKATLDNPFYFISDGILFKISNTQDQDKCGKHKVTYNPLLDSDKQPLTKDVKKDEIYLDEHHDEQKASADGTKTVYGNELNHTECAKTFPHFEVNYTYTQGTDENQTTTPVQIHYYLQSMIEVGDKFTNNTFVRNNVHTSENDVDYITEFQNSIKKDIKDYAESGYTLEQIKNLVPHWYLTSNIDEEFKIYGKKMKFVSVSSNITQMTDEQLMDEIYKAINDLSVKFIDNKLSNYGKKLKRDNEDKVIIVTKNSVVNK